MAHNHNTETLPQEKVPTTVRLTPDVYEALRDRAHALRTTHSAYIENLLRADLMNEKAAA